MANTTNKTQSLQGDMAFYDNYIPTLEDGLYTISAATQINDLDTDTYFEDPITQQFAVSGPQFTLPAADIHSIYPPVNGNSVYDQYLPNIVFSKRVLPWERYFDVDDSSKPWLCLLVFAEGEIAVNPQTNSSLITSTVSDFLAAADDVLKPGIDPDTVAPSLLDTNCSSIQVTADVFRAIAPTVDEVAYLAHVREVDISSQATTDAQDPGWFSVLTGNRLLQSQASGGTRYYVHLVSLEGYYDLLSGSTPWPKKASNDQQDQDIALVSLYNWTFLSQPQPLDFKELVENFSNQADGNADNLLLRRYVSSPDNPDAATQRTLTRLKDGYVPLNYHTSTGEATFAWYRGPFTPVIAQPLPPTADGGIPSSSSLMIYDQKTGIFDQSYAAAWTMGRSLALADGHFSHALWQYRKKAYQIVGKLMDKLPPAPDNDEQVDLQKVLQQSFLLDSFQDLLKENIGATLTELLANPLVASSVPTTPLATPATENAVQETVNFMSQFRIYNLLWQEMQNELTPIVKWLAQTQLLYKVPFNQLVPDQLALPVESLRFFYIDQNWLDCLADGALSLGVQSSKDVCLNVIMRSFINKAVMDEIKSMPGAGTATGDTEADAPQEAMSGILIRSAVVSGWPGLVVKAYQGGALNGTQLKTIRMERLSSTVLLCLFLDIPDTVILAEPQQGVCFGVEDGGVINLRKLSDQTGEPTGQEFPDTEGGFACFFRNQSTGIGQGVLNFNEDASGVVPSLNQVLAQQSSDSQTTEIGPAQLALEMFKAPEEISFTNLTD